MFRTKKRLEALEWKAEALLIKMELAHGGNPGEQRYTDHLKKAPKSVLEEIEREKRK